MKTKAGDKKFREVLIFVTGTTPQIITETIYAMIHNKPPVHPDELYILTTGHGERAIKENLIGSRIFKDFCKEFQLSETLLDERSIVVIKDDRQNPFNDIKSEIDNEQLGNFISAFIRGKAEDNTARLHCSLAGGRKTMSFYMGAALQFYGRPWDKLYHVLVSPEFESNADFYYKPKKNRIIRSNGKSLNTKDARIDLTELPFIRLRDKLNPGQMTFRELVREGQKDIDTAMMQPGLAIDLRDRTVQIGDNIFKLPPIQLMIYTAYLRHKLKGCNYPDRPYCMDCTDCFPSMLELSTKPALEEMAKDYMFIAPSRVEDLLYKYKDGLPLDIIRQAVSKIKKSVKTALSDDALSACYSVNTSHRNYAASRHGVRVEKGKIWIE